MRYLILRLFTKWENVKKKDEEDSYGYTITNYEKMWDIETELFSLQSTLETLTKMADWKSL